MFRASTDCWPILTLLLFFLLWPLNNNISMIIVVCVREHIFNLDWPVLWRSRKVEKNYIIYKKLFTIIDAYRPVKIELNVFLGNMAKLIQGFFYMKQLTERAITHINLFRLHRRIYREMKSIKRERKTQPGSQVRLRKQKIQ